MRSKLIKLRGPTVTPILFLLMIVAMSALLAIIARTADKYRAIKNQPQPNLTLCPLCEQPVPSSR